MEIISNGSIPYGQTKEEFFESISMPVNESLMRVFIATGLCEHTGHGVPVILKRYGEDAFEIGGNSVRVRMPFERKRRIISDEGEHTDTLSKKERNVLSILMTNPKITLKDVSEILSIGQSNVLATVSGLKAKGVLIREGSKKNGEWKVLIR